MRILRVAPAGLVLGGVLFIASCACNPAAQSALAVPMRSQETPMWCWAASGQMVMEFLGTTVTQCVQANNRFNRTDCPCNQCGPNPQANPPCVNGGWPEFDRYGFTFTRTTGTALTEAQLRRELAQGAGCGRRPVAFSWRWNGGGGHMMVATGYQVDDGALFVSISDPLPVCAGSTRILTYAAYVSGGGYTHWDDFYEIRPTP